MEQSERPNYYAVIPACVRYDSTLPPNAKLLYGEICALSNKEGKCWPSNAYFERLYSVGETSVKRWLKALSKGGYITVEIEYKPGSKEVLRRTISPLGGGADFGRGWGSFCAGRGAENGPENNIKMNIEGKAPKQTRFTPPTLDEVKAFCEQRHNGIDPEYFIAYYERNGWRVGRNNAQMKSWKATVITWEKNNKARAGAGGEELAYI